MLSRRCDEDEYKGLDDRAVKDRVVPLLVAMENGDDADDEDKKMKRKREEIWRQSHPRWENTGFDGCVYRVLD